LIKGGIFLYPKDSKAPKGKLRLLYELYPLGLIIERSGGLAIDDDGTRILNKEVKEIH
jgi:fructose-1,6-bisphosphatase I